MKPPINIDASLKAKAELSLKGEIPKSSLGRLVDSFTDIFRPFTESRGLRADEIRLQRLDVAIEIAKRSRAAIAIEGMKTSPIDPKILIPLIEKSSLENPSDDEMLNRWSALLANAADKKIVEPRYVQILSELNSTQASMLERIALNGIDDAVRSDAFLDDVADEKDAVRIRQYINAIFRDRRTKLNKSSIFDRIIRLLDGPGCIVVDIIYFDNKGPDSDMYVLESELLFREHFESAGVDLEILGSLGLLRKVSVFYNTKFKEEIQVFYWHMTELGVRFYRAVNRRAKSV